MTRQATRYTVLWMLAITIVFAVVLHQCGDLSRLPGIEVGT